MIVYHEQIAHSATELLVCCSSSVSCLREGKKYIKGGGGE